MIREHKARLKQQQQQLALELEQKPTLPTSGYTAPSPQGAEEVLFSDPATRQVEEDQNYDEQANERSWVRLSREQ